MNAIEETMDEDAFKALLMQLPAVPEAVWNQLVAEGIRAVLFCDRRDRIFNLLIESTFERLPTVKKVLADFDIRRPRWPRLGPRIFPNLIFLWFHYSPTGWTAGTARRRPPSFYVLMKYGPYCLTRTKQ